MKMGYSMKPYLRVGLLVLLPSILRAGNITTLFSPLGTVSYSSGTAAAAPSSITLVQSIIDGANGSTLGTAFSSPLTAGNTIYVAIGQASATFNITLLTDGCGDTFTEATNSPVTGTGNRIRVYTAPTAGGCSSLNITSSVSAPYNVLLAELNNASKTSIIDCDTGGSGNSVNLLTSAPACTTSHASDMLVAFGFQPVDTVTFTAGASYTIRQQNGGTGHSAAYEDQSVFATGTYTGSETSNTSGQWTIHMMAIKANP